ncbi:MAG TPA: hypothetical protein VGJ00_00295 [Rhabdochlamydiaceae bacterium]|jgi:hypothetical protein
MSQATIVTRKSVDSRDYTAQNPGFMRADPRAVENDAEPLPANISTKTTQKIAEKLSTLKFRSTSISSDSLLLSLLMKSIAKYKFVILGIALTIAAILVLHYFNSNLMGLILGQAGVITGIALTVLGFPKKTSYEAITDAYTSAYVNVANHLQSLFNPKKLLTKKSENLLKESIISELSEMYRIVTDLIPQDEAEDYQVQLQIFDKNITKKLKELQFVNDKSAFCFKSFEVITLIFGKFKMKNQTECYLISRNICGKFNPTSWTQKAFLDNQGDITRSFDNMH